MRLTAMRAVSGLSALAMNSASCRRRFCGGNLCFVGAARGQGDYSGAWAAAQAGWVRGALAPDHGAGLRGDIDRLVLRALIPERARATGLSPDTLRADWDAFKERWNR